MKFTCKVGGLVLGLSPIMNVSQKGVQDNYTYAFLITLKSEASHLEAIADGGHISAVNEIDNKYNLDYVQIEPGTVTVNSNDLQSLLASFSPHENITVETREVKSADGTSSTKELFVIPVSDPEQHQTLPVFDTHCEFQKPPVAKKTNHITIRRDLFTNYANKIMFAHGFQEQFKNFTYWILRSYKSGAVRFAAGTGMRFAVVDLEGANISDAKGDSNIYFPNEQTQTIISVLNQMKDINVSIESHDRCISMKCDKLKMNLYTCDPSIEWPDENSFLTRSSKFSFTTKIGNWRNAVKGILATNSDEAKQQTQPHHCSLNFDMTKKVIQTKSDSMLKSCRKIAIDDIATSEADKEVTIRCVSKYISEIISKSSDEDYIQIEIENAKSPVIVRFYSGPTVGDPLRFKKPSEDGISERYAVFFATLKG